MIQKLDKKALALRIFGKDSDEPTEAASEKEGDKGSNDIES